MVEIKVHTVIADARSAWLYAYDGGEGVFSLEFIQRLFEEHPDETDFRFNIHCPGGEVAEGLAIYDFLRTSGKNIYMNIEGACHSMAVCILLAAPRENRTANPNSRALIHKVYTECAGGTADELTAQADSLRSLQNSILQIYADRTDLTLEDAERIMSEEQFHTAEELLEWGFISKINTYNTNSLTNKRKTMNALLEKITNFLTEVKQEFTQAVNEATNYVFYGEDGAELFSTEAEDDRLEVGMKASPDGVFEVGDRTIVIEGGVITEIRDEREAEDEEKNALQEQVAALTAQVEELKNNLTAANAECDTLREQVNTATTLLNEAKAQIKSTGKIGNRIGSTTTKDIEPNDREERKALIRSKLKK